MRFIYGLLAAFMAMAFEATDYKHGAEFSDDYALLAIAICFAAGVISGGIRQ